MTTNPYQAPRPIVEPNARSVFGELTLAERFNDRQRGLLLSSCKLVSRGQNLVALSATLFGLSVAIRTSNPLAADSINASLILFGVGSGLIVKLAGVSTWCSLQGPERMFSMLAMSLQVLAMFATGTFVVATLNGRFVGGLFPLFGASAFAMLLTSQAIISLVNRSWAMLLRDRLAVHSSELSVIGYAICASLCAANAMNVIPQRGPMTGIGFITLFVGIVALVLQTISHQQTLRSMESELAVTNIHAASVDSSDLQ